MNRNALTLLFAFGFAFSLQAHCGTCSMDGMASDHTHSGDCAEQQLDPYFAVQEGLAADDLSKAKNGAKGFLAHCESQSCSTAEDCCCSAEKTAAAAIADATDIAVARLAFKDWSVALLEKVEAGGLRGTVAYEMHCPMAFSNEGGTWLQAKPELRNPYFGSLMLTCGTLTGSHQGDAAKGADCCGSGSQCCEDAKKKSCCES